MSFVDAEILKDVLGPQAAGPAGFGIRYEVDSGINVDPDTRAVEVKLNETTLEKARQQNESGVNKHVAKTLEPSKTSHSLINATTQNNKADARYGALFNKRGLQDVADRTNALAPSFGARRSDHRAALSKQPNSKNPLLRIKQRHLLRLRETFNEIAKNKKKTVGLNPESLPRSVLVKMIEQALVKGSMVTPLGPVAKAVKIAGFNHKEWARWGHALMDGSFPTATPRPRGGA